ncbi:unnamed protein product [Cyclocybe aegerita]|uniref:Prolyl 4-hydroxylase alpha subunit Fe(2+) 2OG dioxygenase domain-containing protein n=1 Tax=Cyclocybe aegerita TaxID=1973307 RepID=A0A8S0WXS4_CYCAE|nr:unnamed protein product [Cyclocybe aegerita]
MEASGSDETPSHTSNDVRDVSPALETDTVVNLQRQNATIQDGTEVNRVTGELDVDVGDDCEDLVGGNDEDDSELSDGEDLCEDLKDCLESSDFSFQGSFYHASLKPTTPNPCLTVGDIGLVGLPLTERDAKAIIACASLAPFGKGKHTVVDPTVRNTWEIEPARVGFANADWVKWVEDVVCKEICNALGVELAQTPNLCPRLQLHKLLLYEPGSHFLPHQDTQKAEGMFATAIIILPSAYTGGQVVVSHASKKKTIDFSSSSLTSTAVLAWYTDVTHEVKRVRSGYRLALSYNLIQPRAPGLERRLPILPDTSSTANRLRRILQKWSEGIYAVFPSQDMVAYLLAHQYSAKELNKGARALKGADRSLVGFLREVVVEEGYILALSSREQYQKGSADCETGSIYARKRRKGNDHQRIDSYGIRGRGYSHGYGWGEDEENEDEDEDEYGNGDDEPDMDDVYETSISISRLVDLDGDLISDATIDTEDDSIIPQNPFEGLSPDRQEYEGYMGNEAGDVEYWYNATVLVLMHEVERDSLMTSSGSTEYAFRKLARSSEPSATDAPWIKKLVDKRMSLNKDQALKMVDYALRVRDLQMWRSIVENPTCTVQSLVIEGMARAWRLFGFEYVYGSFALILDRSERLADRLDFIKKLPDYALDVEKTGVQEWCRLARDHAFASYNSVDVSEIPTLVNIMRDDTGLQAFNAIMLPNLVGKENGYDFCVALVRAMKRDLQSKAEELSTDVPSGSPPDRESLLNNAIKSLLAAAASQWKKAPATTYPAESSDQVQAATVSRIVEIVELSITNGRLDVCEPVFVDTLQATEPSSVKFPQLYTPLIPRLRDILNRHGLDICLPPFLNFFQVLIATYLKDVLGKKGSRKHRPRKIGCGCKQCKILDAFILDGVTTMRLFSALVQGRKAHLEKKLAEASDLCSFETTRTGALYSIRVTKRPELLHFASWERRTRAAETFLASVGTDDVIQKIMGGRYEDVKYALAGLVPFDSALPSTCVGNTRSQPPGEPAPGPSSQAPIVEPGAIEEAANQPPETRNEIPSSSAEAVFFGIRPRLWLLRIICLCSLLSFSLLWFVEFTDLELPFGILLSCILVYHVASAFQLIRLWINPYLDLFVLFCLIGGLMHRAPTVNEWSSQVFVLYVVVVYGLVGFLSVLAILRLVMIAKNRGGLRMGWNYDMLTDSSAGTDTPSAQNILLGKSIWQRHINGEASTLILARGILAIVLIFSLSAVSIVAIVLDPLRDSGLVPIKEVRSLDVPTDFKGEPSVWNVIAPPQFLALHASISTAVTILKGFLKPSRSIVRLAFRCPREHTWFPIPRSDSLPNLLVIVNFTRIRFRDDLIDTAKNSIQIIVNLTNDTNLAARRTQPTTIPPGVNLMGTLNLELRQLHKNPSISALGFTSSETIMVTRMGSVFPDPEAGVSPLIPQSSNISTFRLFVQNDPSEWRIIMDYRDKSVIGGFSTVGGLWAFLSGIFTAIFGTSLMRIIFGVKPLSVLGMAHSLQGHQTIREQISEDYKGAAKELQDAQGVIALLRDHVIDFSFLVEVRKTANSAIEAKLERTRETGQAETVQETTVPAPSHDNA